MNLNSDNGIASTAQVIAILKYRPVYIKLILIAVTKTCIMPIVTVTKYLPCD